MDYKGEYIDEMPQKKWSAVNNIIILLHDDKVELDHFINTVYNKLNHLAGKDYHIGFEFYDKDSSDSELNIWLYEKVLETPEQTDMRIAEQKRHIDAKLLTETVEEDKAIRFLLERGYSVKKEK